MTRPVDRVVYVTDMGYLFRLTRRNYLRLMVHIAAEEGEWHLTKDFGARPVATQVHSITDIDREGAIDALTALDAPRRLLVDCHVCGAPELRSKAQPAHRGRRTREWICRICQDGGPR